jgi:hypothetical protein
VVFRVGPSSRPCLARHSELQCRVARTRRVPILPTACNFGSWGSSRRSLSWNCWRCVRLAIGWCSSCLHFFRARKANRHTIDVETCNRVAVDTFLEYHWGFVAHPGSPSGNSLVATMRSRPRRMYCFFKTFSEPDRGDNGSTPVESFPTQTVSGSTREGARLVEARFRLIVRMLSLVASVLQSSARLYPST